MAVCRKRSTNSAPLALSISYFTGNPPAGISMSTFTSFGGLRPAGIFEISMLCSSKREQNLSDVRTPRHFRVRGLRLGERIFFVDHRLDRGRLDQRPDGF